MGPPGRRCARRRTRLSIARLPQRDGDHGVVGAEGDGRGRVVGTAGIVDFRLSGAVFHSCTVPSSMGSASVWPSADQPASMALAGPLARALPREAPDVEFQSWMVRPFEIRATSPRLLMTRVPAPAAEDRARVRPPSTRTASPGAGLDTAGEAESGAAPDAEPSGAELGAARGGAGDRGGRGGAGDRGGVCAGGTRLSGRDPRPSRSAIAVSGELRSRPFPFSRAGGSRRLAADARNSWLHLACGPVEGAAPDCPLRMGRGSDWLLPVLSAAHSDAVRSRSATVQARFDHCVGSRVQARRVPSPLCTMRRPSGTNLACASLPSCAGNGGPTTVQLGTSKSTTVPSLAAEASSRPSGEKLTLSIASACGRLLEITDPVVGSMRLTDPSNPPSASRRPSGDHACAKSPNPGRPDLVRCHVDDVETVHLP